LRSSSEKLLTNALLSEAIDPIPLFLIHQAVLTCVLPLGNRPAVAGILIPNPRSLPNLSRPSFRVYVRHIPLLADTVSNGDAALLTDACTVRKALITLVVAVGGTYQRAVAPGARWVVSSDASDDGGHVVLISGFAGVGLDASENRFDNLATRSTP
jgi:hypothetical protein